jgi:hypothetical protein
VFPGLPLDDEQRLDLMTAFTRAKLLVAAPVDGRSLLVVPPLSYAEYEPAIQAMVRAADAFRVELNQSSAEITKRKVPARHAMIDASEAGCDCSHALPALHDRRGVGRRVLPAPCL